MVFRVTNYAYLRKTKYLANSSWSKLDEENHVQLEELFVNNGSRDTSDTPSVIYQSEHSKEPVVVATIGKNSKIPRLDQYLFLSSLFFDLTWIKIQSYTEAAESGTDDDLIIRWLVKGLM